MTEWMRVEVEKLISYYETLRLTSDDDWILKRIAELQIELRERTK